MARRKNERKPKNIAEAIGFKNLLSSEKTDFLIGVLLAAAAVFLCAAMVSFLQTGQADQSILEDLRPGEWLNTDRSFKNSCGSIGAILSYSLVTVNLGLPSFLIPLFMAVAGLKMMKACDINLWKWFFCTIAVMVWSSIAFTKFLTPLMPNEIYNPGGGHGVYCVQHLENIIGTPGLVITIIISAIAFFVYLSSATIRLIRKILNPAYIKDKVKETIANTSNEQQQTQQEQQPQPKQESAEAGGEVIPPDVQPKTAEHKTVIDLTDGQDDQTGHAVIQTEQKVLNEAAVNNGKEIKIETPHTEEASTGRTVSPEADITTPINPKEPFTRYKYPTLDLLKKYDMGGKPLVDMHEIKANNEQIVKVLKSFGVDIKEIKATIGPTITLYEITPSEGVRISKIRNLEDDIALSLAALGIRIIAPMPGKGTIGIEVPNRKPTIVSMESILNTRKFQESKFDLPIALGKSITNDVFIVDLAKIPHLLVAGATGQGKSVGLNAIITSLLYKKHPNELKLVLIDPKKVEFSIYSPIADHFMASLPENDDEPIITDVTKVVRTLKSLCTLMDKRYDMLKIAGVRNIKEYNTKFVNHKLRLTDGHEYMPYIVVVIDEFGDLIMTAGKEIETPIARIAQLARAVGIHMVIATQRPTTSIITGNIKANFPGRMAFKVTSNIDSRTILDRSGADRLIGRGDMLILDGKDPNPCRLQCAFVDTPEVEQICEHISAQPGPVEPMELPEPKTADEDGADSTVTVGSSGGSTDALFVEAARAIVTSRIGSTSMIQRRFSIGYNRAGRLMDQLEKAGIVGAAHGSKPRDVLIADENQLCTLLEQIK